MSCGRVCARGERSAAIRGFKYEDRYGYPDGLHSAQLRPRMSGNGQLPVKGKRAGVPFGPLAFGPGTTMPAQLQSSAGGCYASVFPPFKRDEAGEFQDLSG